MPRKLRKPCKYPGCPKLTNGQFFETHAKQDVREYEKYRRNPETRKRYGREWKHIRDRYITAHPLCELCQKNGQLNPATQVHHISPVKDSYDNSESNLMSLCAAHHSALHLRDRNRNV